MLESSLFPTFFMAGFECSDHKDWAGRRLDQIGAYQHDRCALEDYRRLLALGIGAVREGARWPRVDRWGGRRYDWAALEPLLAAAQELGMVVCWDLFHYGYPDDLDFLGPDFVPRFARFAHAFTEHALQYVPADQLWVTPVNEPSYFSYTAGTMGHFWPALRERGGDVKRQAVRAHIAGAEAVWAVAPAARVLTVDPMVHAHPPADEPGLAAQAAWWNRHVMFEAFDMICGYKEPELGGDRRYLGTLGINLYSCCQWEIARIRQFIMPDNPRFFPLHKMMQFAAGIYGGPMVIGETSELRSMRPHWLRLLLDEVLLARAAGVDVQGVCWYPVVTAPDWEDGTAFYDAGLWDARPQPDGTLARVLFAPLAAELRRWQPAQE